MGQQRRTARRDRRTAVGTARALIEALESRQMLSASVSGYVYVDANADGVYQPAEETVPFSGVMLSGTDDLGNPVESYTFTDYGGYYEFSDLRPGTYTLTAEQSMFYLDGSDTVGTQGGAVVGEDSITFRLGENTRGTGNNFGELIPASLSGNVYRDANNDGVYEDGESGVADVAVMLTGTNDRGEAVELTAFTNSSGYYEFYFLRPGTYALTEVQPEGFVSGRNSVGTPGGVLAGDTMSGIVLGPEINGADNNFAEVLDSSVSGLVVDQNGAGIAGVEVTLAGTDDGGNAVLVTTVTDGAGRYEFVMLRPGSYTVHEVQPAGWLDGAETVGTPLDGVVVGNDTFAFNLVPGTHGYYNNFAEVAPASLGGRVSVAADGAAIANVRVSLYDAGGNLVATTTTDAGGAYAFVNLYPGTYRIVETQPGAYDDGPEVVGSLGGDALVNDSFANVVVAAGQNGVGYDFTELVPPPVTTPTVVSLEWNTKAAQKLILLLGATPVSLGNWLAATLPNLYGPTAGANNLSGKTQAQVADRYNVVRKGSDGQVNAAVLDLALSIFASTGTLNSTAQGQAAAVQAGLGVTAATQGSNLANRVVNVGTNGAAFGVADRSSHTVLSLLKALDGKAVKGVLWGGEPNKTVSKFGKMVTTVLSV